MTPLRWLPALVLCAVGLVGCAHKQQQSPCNTCGPNTLPPGARVVPAPPPGATIVPAPGGPGAPYVQPGPGPGGSGYLPNVPQDADPNRPQFPSSPSGNPTTRRPVGQGQVRLPEDLFAPGNVQQSTYQPNNEPAGVRLAPPELGTGDGRTPPVRLGPPTKDEPPLADPAQGERKEPQSAATPSRVDLPEFATVRPGVSIGLQPYTDGVVWLQNQGYHTVLHLRAPDATDTAAQRVFEHRRIRYVSLQVAPGAITREAVEAFNRVIADPNARPLFVFDNDGGLAPGMFYLHFRTAGGLNHEQALAEASRLGFRPDANATHRAFLQAATTSLNAQ